jgi:hypothetical protein
MKKLHSALVCAVILTFFLNASIWEGSASASMGGEFPERGYYAATNSFPKNTMVDITNLENGKTIRVIVSQGLDSPGLLAILSREAADAIGLGVRSIGRVRMNQTSDSVAYSRFSDGIRIMGGDPDHDPAALLEAEGGIDPAIFDSPSRSDFDWWGWETLSNDTRPEVPPDIAARGEPVDEWDNFTWMEIGAAGLMDKIDKEESKSVEDSVPVVEAQAVYPPYFDPDAMERYEFTMESSELRVPDSVNTAPPIQPSDPAIPPGRVQTMGPHHFSVPVIANLERGKYYIQVAALSRPDSIENEIRKIGTDLPMAIQTIGTTDTPVYRLLVGPVDLGESGALLQRFKITYSDAFVRQGS